MYKKSHVCIESMKSSFWTIVIFHYYITTVPVILSDTPAKIKNYIKLLENMKLNIKLFFDVVFSDILMIFNHHVECIYLPSKSHLMVSSILSG